MKMTDDWLCVCGTIIPAEVDHEHLSGYPPVARLPDDVPVSMHEYGDGEEFAKLSVENEFLGEGE